VRATGEVIHATPGFVADGIRQTPAVVEGGITSTGEIIHATPGVIAEGVHQVSRAE
jgi:hypothetical protein